ncbi:MAG: protein DA1 [Lentisphaeria bacterium]|nr:protein DA1 [Lentisphaeria bacterium]
MLILVSGALLLAATKTCSECGTKLRGKYLTSNGRVFCSQACYEKTLPKCTACGRRIKGPFVRVEGKPYCSKKCRNTILPKCEICNQPLLSYVRVGEHLYCKEHAKNPPCDACGLPVGRGAKLGDGRIVCANCRPDLVLQMTSARILYMRARDDFHVITGLKSPTLPPLALVGLEKMPGYRVGQAPSELHERGFYHRKETTTEHKTIFGMVLAKRTDVTERISILYGLPRQQFVSTATHELMHDIISERYPKLAGTGPTWVEEGLCQYAASLVCRRHGYEEQLERLAKNISPDYGDSYRYFLQLFGENGAIKMLRWLATADGSRMPTRPPELE